MQFRLVSNWLISTFNLHIASRTRRNPRLLLLRTLMKLVIDICNAAPRQLVFDGCMSYEETALKPLIEMTIIILLRTPWVRKRWFSVIGSGSRNAMWHLQFGSFEPPNPSCNVSVAWMRQSGVQDDAANRKLFSIVRRLWKIGFPCSVMPRLFAQCIYSQRSPRLDKSCTVKSINLTSSDWIRIICLQILSLWYRNVMTTICVEHRE